MSLSLGFQIILLSIPFLFLLLLLTSCFDLWFSIYGFLLHKKKNRISDMESKGSDADCTKKPIIVILRGTSLPDDEIKSSLNELFSTCGKVDEVYIPTSVLYESSNKYAFVYFTGEYFQKKAAEKKALKLNGTYVGGSNIKVKVMPAKAYPELYVDRAESRERARTTPCFVLVFVRKLDTSRDESATIELLRKCFAKCGKIGRVFVNHSSAAIQICGLEHEVKAKASALNGEVVDGWKVVVQPFKEEEEINFNVVYS